MELESQDLLARKIEELQKIFPEIVVDGVVDTDKLHALLYPNDEKKSEHYSFTWSGKKECYQIIREKSNATLKLDPDTTVPQGDNVFIEGDNLEVLKLLQNAYHKKIKMIYIDPPYNKDKDFVYKDTWGDTITNYLIQTDQLRDEGYTSTRTSSTGRRHTNWLNMIYPRLWLSRNLLRDDGVIFVSIDDDEVHNLRKVMDEVFGEENFIAQFPRLTKKAGKSSDNLAINHDYILAYNKNHNYGFNTFAHDDIDFKYTDEFVEERGKYKLNQTLDYGSIQYSPSLDYEISIEERIFRPGNVSKEKMEERKQRNPKSDFCWRWSKELFEFGTKNGFVVVKENRIYTKTYQNAKISKNSAGYFVEIKERTKAVTTLEFLNNKYSNDNSKKDLSKLFQENVFDYSKPTELLKVLTFLGTEKDDIILDFFAGSGTTADAVMAQNLEDEGNRRYILVQLPEPTDEKSEAYKAGYKKISDITKARIIKAMEKLGYDNGFKSYILDNSNFQRFKEIKKRPGESIEEIEKMLRMSMFHENILTQGAKKLDVVYEIGLKNGFSLSAEYETIQKGTYTIIRLYEETREFFFTFDHTVGNDIRDHFPRNSKLICYDKALDDSTKLNLRDYFMLETL